ncbi:zinc finger protein ZFP69B-like isoform X2 [Pomacea canaliculata]|nr:zinc finger protein ZFP69B-like isoform X2 [Pomacea canaliculata]
MKKIRTCVQIQSDSTLTIKEEKKSHVIVDEEEAMSAINNQVQVSCVRSIKTEPRSVADLQEDLKDNVMLKTSSFCSDSDMTYCSPISCMQLENISAPAYIKPEHTWHIPESNWKHEDAVKLELNPQDAYCIKTDCSHKNAVKVEYHCQDVTCSIKSEQHLVKCAKIEEQLLFKQEEQDDCPMVKTETGSPGQYAMWQNNIDENSLEMSVARCITPEVKENQHQTHQTVAEVTIDTATEIHKKQRMMHSDLKAYSCTPCSVVLERIDTSKQHKETNINKRSHHSVERPHQCIDKKPHQCTVCHKDFRRLDALKLHMATHNNVRPYQCSICKSTFKLSSHLKQHIVPHRDMRPPQCYICPLVFKKPQYLKQHMVNHSDVKLYQCSICRKTFRWSSDLIRHMLTHKDVTFKQKTKYIIHPPLGNL